MIPGAQPDARAVPGEEHPCRPVRGVREPCRSRLDLHSGSARAVEGHGDGLALPQWLEQTSYSERALRVRAAEDVISKAGREVRQAVSVLAF